MKAVLFIHGFSAKEEDNIYFIEEMKKQKNIDMYTFILPGHETKIMKKVKYQDWLEASEEELQIILKKYDKVTIVAHSMGTIIAMNLASRYKEIKKLVLIAPAYMFGNAEQNKKDIKNILTKQINPDIGTGFEGALTKFLTVPLSRFFEYRKLVKNNEEVMKKVTCKTLILHGTKDNLVPLKSSLYVYNILPCEKSLTILEDVRHQVFKSKKKEIITKYIYEYIIGGIKFKINERDII